MTATETRRVRASASLQSASRSWCLEPSVVLLQQPCLAIMSSPSDDAKYDDGIEKAFDEADEEASVHVKRYIESLTLEDIGRRFCHQSLETFHIGLNIPAVQDFYSSSRTLDEIEAPESTPLDHPLRAIAWVLNDAPANTIIRLTDPVSIDLLIHAGSTKTAQVILHDNAKTRIALKTCTGKLNAGKRRDSLGEPIRNSVCIAPCTADA